MHYIKGPNNVIADTFLWLEQINDSLCLGGKKASLEMTCVFEKGCDIVQDAHAIECFLKLPHIYDHGKNSLITNIYLNSKLKTRNFNKWLQGNLATML